MKRIAGIFLVSVVFTCLLLPIEGSAQKGLGKGRGHSNGMIWTGNQPGKRRNGPWYGYKNYGQYRRTQVGNRRYRWVSRHYWRNGIRLTRRVRIYY
jgi:hypothetical protein